MDVPAPTGSTSAPSPSSLGAALLADIEAGRLELPLLPDTVSDVLAACNDPDCDARDLADRVERDASIAGHALRVANSSLYAPVEPIVSLQQAVGRLGFRTVCEITLSVALRGTLFDVPDHAESLRELWIHSAASGAFAKEIARVRRRNVEGAFLVGLLHDVGRPVILHALARRAAEAPDGPDELERLLDDFHARVGARLIESWSLPGWIARAIEHHHDPRAMRGVAEEAWTVHLADELAYWAVSPDEKAEEAVRAHAACIELNLYPAEVEGLLAMGERVASASRAFLETTGSPR